MRVRNHARWHFASELDWCMPSLSMVPTLSRVANINLWFFLFLVENCACFCPQFPSPHELIKTYFFIFFEVMCDREWKSCRIDVNFHSTPLDIIKFNSIMLDFEQKHSGDDGDVSIYNFISPFWSASMSLPCLRLNVACVQIKFSISASFHWNA